MRKFALFVGLVSLVGSGAVQAATYQDWFSTTYSILTIDFPYGPHPYSGPDLEPGVGAPGAFLSGASIFHADLTNANLSSANLSGASMGGAYLIGTNLSSADLTCTNVTDANLSSANLSGANLTCANLSDANLSGANLSGANLCSANLSDAFNLGTTTGIPNYDALTDFTGALSGVFGSAPFDPVAAGWNLCSAPAVPSLEGVGLGLLVMSLLGATAWRVRRRIHRLPV